MKKQNSDFKRLLIEVGEHMDYIGIRCALCKKILASEYVGMYGSDGLNISEEEYQKMLKHNCSKMKKQKI